MGKHVNCEVSESGESDIRMAGGEGLESILDSIGITGTDLFGCKHDVLISDADGLIVVGDDGFAYREEMGSETTDSFFENDLEGGRYG